MSILGDSICLIPAAGVGFYCGFDHDRFKDYVHINLDILHTRNKEKLLLQECVEGGRSFVGDNTNPTREDREKYIRAARDHGYHVQGYYFQSSVSDCIARNQNREGKAKVPDQAVAATHRKLELPEYGEVFVATKWLQKF